MTRPPRKIIPDEQCLVVLDTSPVRDVAYASETSPWVPTFGTMAKDGYSFSLADDAFAELISQHARGSTTDDQRATIVSAAETYLNPAFPKMPGKVDLMRMIGESDAPAGWEAEVRILSQRAWHMLRAASSGSANESIIADAELQEDRGDCIGAFAGSRITASRRLRGMCT